MQKTKNETWLDGYLGEKMSAHIACFFSIFLLTPILIMTVMEAHAMDGEDIRAPRFSPDGKVLIFDRCAPEKYADSCRIHVYNLDSGALGYYQPPAGQTWMQANYSYDGDKLAFVTMPVQDRSKSWYAQREDVFLKSQLAIMNADGSDVRVLTTNSSYKGMPAFSHSGNKIIFVQSEKLRDSGKTVAAYWDLWELDLKTNQQELFAGRNGFYQMGLPEYFLDDQHVLLNGDAPMLSLLKGTQETFSARQDDYMKRYKGNTLFKVKRAGVLEPPLFTEFSGAQTGCLDGLGNIYFYAVFLKEGFRVRRIGVDGLRADWKYPPLQSNSMSLLGMNVSHDGSHIVMSIKDGDTGKLMLLDTASGFWRELVLPEAVEQINQ